MDAQWARYEQKQRHRVLVKRWQGRISAGRTTVRGWMAETVEGRVQYGLACAAPCAARARYDALVRVYGHNRHHCGLAQRNVYVRLARRENQYTIVFDIQQLRAMSRRPRAMSLHTPRLALHTGTPWHTGAVIPGTRRVGRGWGGQGAGSGAGRPARVGAGVGHWNFGRDRKTV